MSSAPTEPGWYWARVRDSTRWEVVHFYEARRVLCVDDEADYDRGDVSEWGPRIPGPEGLAWHRKMLADAAELVPTVEMHGDEEWNDDDGLAWHGKLKKGPPI